MIASVTEIILEDENVSPGSEVDVSYWLQGGSVAETTVDCRVVEEEKQMNVSDNKVLEPMGYGT